MKVAWGRCTVQAQLISAARGWNESQRRIVRSRLAKWAMVKWPGLHMKFWDSYGCIAWHCFQRLYKLSNVNQGLITPPPPPYKRRSRRSRIVSIDLKWPIPPNKETSRPEDNWTIIPYTHLPEGWYLPISKWGTPIGGELLHIIWRIKLHQYKKMTFWHHQTYTWRTYHCFEGTKRLWRWTHLFYFLAWPPMTSV